MGKFQSRIKNLREKRSREAAYNLTHWEALQAEKAEALKKAEKKP